MHAGSTTKSRRSRRLAPAWCAVVAIAATLSALTGCGPSSGSASTAGTEQAEVRTETVTYGPINLTVSFEPADVKLDEDVLMTITVNAPELTTVNLPSLEDRLTGFSHGGEYGGEPVTSDGRTVRELHVRLVPVIADEYRIAPFAVTYVDKSVDPPLTGWFPTPPFVLAFTPPAGGDGLAGAVEPVWIPPPFRVVMAYIAGGILLLVLLWLLWRLLTRVRETVALRRMSPRERALRELQRLLARHLVERGLLKDFYVELTMVVRRYIERRHAIRAPEQTTEEFLAAAGRNTRFSREVLQSLRTFLEAADRVKFAAHKPQPGDIDTAVDTARVYIERDAAQDEPTVQEGGT